MDLWIDRNYRNTTPITFEIINGEITSWNLAQFTIDSMSDITRGEQIIWLSMQSIYKSSLTVLENIYPEESNNFHAIDELKANDNDH